MSFRLNLTCEINNSYFYDLYTFMVFRSFLLVIMGGKQSGKMLPLYCYIFENNIKL